MGTKVPSTVTGGGLGEGFAINAASWVKRGWGLQKAQQFEYTLDVIRELRTSPDPSTGRKGTVSQVSGLDNLPCTYETPADENNMMVDSDMTIRQSSMIFTLYDVPATALTDPGQVLLTDRISFEGNMYQVDDVTFEKESGRCVVVASMARD